MKPNHLFLDQFGEPIWARTVKELREKVGGGRVTTMYRDKKDGSVVLLRLCHRPALVQPFRPGRDPG